MGFQSIPLADVFPCHLQVVLNISLYRESSWSKLCRVHWKGEGRWYELLGMKGFGGFVGFLCPPACLSCYSSLLSFLCQKPHLSFEYVKFSFMVVRPSFFYFPVVLSPRCEASSLLFRWLGSPSSSPWAYTSVAALCLPLLQLSSVLNVLKNRKRLKLLAYSALLSFEEINLIWVLFTSKSDLPSAGTVLSPCRNSTWVAAHIKVNEVIIVHWFPHSHRELSGHSYCCVCFWF